MLILNNDTHFLNLVKSKTHKTKFDILYTTPSIYFSNVWIINNNQLYIQVATIDYSHILIQVALSIINSSFEIGSPHVFFQGHCSPYTYRIFFIVAHCFTQINVYFISFALLAYQRT
jgi:hypothetical protein